MAITKEKVDSVLKEILEEHRKELADQIGNGKKFVPKYCEIIKFNFICYFLDDIKGKMSDKDVEKIINYAEPFIVKNNQKHSEFPSMQIKTDWRDKDAEPKNSMCFIATATYESYNAPEVIFLRNWRDNVLLKSKVGTLFVKLYYHISPFIAKMVKNNYKLKIISKFLLNKFISIIKK